MNIVLLGLMGTGKTFLGNQLAARLGYRFVDTDEVIEERQQRSIPEIFGAEGEPYFRRLEQELTCELTGADRQVIATGGGLVTNPVNLDLLKQNGFLITLTAPPEVIFERVKSDTHRPLLKVADPLAKIRELLRERAIFYRQADLIVNTAVENAGQLVERVIGELKQRGFIE